VLNVVDFFILLSNVATPAVSLYLKTLGNKIQIQIKEEQIDDKI